MENSTNILKGRYHNESKERRHMYVIMVTKLISSIIKQ